MHEELGPGVYESVYQRCMEAELRARGLVVHAQVPVAIIYRGETVAEEGFRIDLLVDDTVVVELKSVEEAKPIHKKRVLTYLRLSRKPLGLPINLNECRLVDGVHRIIDTPRSEGKSWLSRLSSWLLSLVSA